MSIMETTPQTVEADAIRERLIRQRLAGGRSRGRAAIARADRSAPLALSSGQRQQWFLSRLEPDSPEYLIPLALRLRGALDTGALHRAWTALVARHEILRTRYELAGAEPVQIIDPAGPVELPVTEAPHGQADQLAQEFADQESRTPFDLATQWPARAAVLRLAAEDHLLVVVFHHIACDGVSLEVFAGELGEFYRAFTEGREPERAALPVQFADFAAWQREQLAEPSAERHMAHWRERLDELTPLELPTDRPRPAQRSWRGDAVGFEIPAAVADRLRAVGEEHGATPFMVLLTGFQALLARYTGRSDIQIGTPIGGRRRPELQGLIGNFANTQVLRGRWEGDPTVAELLAANRATVLDAFDHQDVPFERLVDELSPERDLSRTPLVQVVFAMHDVRAAVLDLPGVTVERVGTSWTIAKFDLTLQVEEGADGALRGRFEYPVALFDRATVERFADHYQRLLASLVASTATPLSRLELIGEAERAFLIGADATADPDVTETVHQLFERQAAATPGRTAVVHQGEALTYAELNSRANRLAHHLRALGAGPDTLVGVCLDRGLDLVVSLLGVLKSGAGYLPLDPSVPEDRLGFMLEDADTRIVVTQAAHTHKLPSGALVVLDREEDLAAIAGRPDSDPAPAPAAGPDNLIYVIYTSGSTGRPKGVQLSHANVVRLFTTTERQFAFGPDDAWTLFHSYAFDFSVWELWGPLLYGGKLVVVPTDVARSPEDFLDLLVAERVTILNQTPSAFRSLVGAARDGDPRLAELALRAVVFGGEKLEIADLAPWIDRLGLDRPALINMYGITETTVHVTYHRIAPGETGSPIGGPIGDLRTYILDPQGNLAPLGVPGEIFVGGPGVARGYLGRPELTAERFVPDPYGRPGDRLYRTGDLARRTAAGDLEFTGRIDSQIKIRGYRVELGEIQAAVTAHPGLRDAIVVLREFAGDKELVAYVLPQDGQAPTPSELRTFLEGTLPSYMVPAAFVALEAFPLTSSGKLDVRALPAPDRAALQPLRAYVAPRTTAEERVAAVWREVLGLEQIGVDDNFFDLGGDSIRAVALVGALKAAGLDAAVRDVFEKRTVAALTELITGRVAPAAPEAAAQPFELLAAGDVEKLPAGVTDAYPLSQIQAGMLFEMFAGDNHNYHNVTSFCVRDEHPFDHAALEAAANAVVARHEILRTSMDLTEFSEPVQLVHRDVRMTVGMQDLGHLEGQAQQDALKAWMTEERTRLFDLDRPPLLRVFAHLTGESEWWVSVTEFHPILEGWSYHSLLMELLTTYQLVRDGKELPEEQPPGVRYADFIAAEKRALACAEDREYWRRTLAGHTKFEFPARWGDPVETPREPYQLTIRYRDLDEKLRALASRAQVPFKSVLHAAHLKVMSQLTHERAFFTGLVCDTRPETLGADKVLGMYLNTVPFAFSMESATWHELVQQVFAREIELWSHRRFPLSAMQAELAEGRRLVEVFFNYLDFHMIDTELLDFARSIDDSPNEFPLNVMSMQGEHILLKTNTHAVSRANAERLASMYRAVLEAMAADPEGDARATYLPADERQRLLVEWNDTAAERRLVFVPDVIEERVRETPDALAVVAGATRLSYAELDARANQYAHHLREAGIGPESVVGVLLARGPELVPVMLGIWKAGAAYVPLDPDYPADRLGYMLSDTGARVLVTESRYAPLVKGVFDGGLVLADTDREQIDAQPVSTPARTGDPDTLAYVIYTSGSTGRPKGVLVPHRGLINYLWWAIEGYAAHGTGGAPLFSSIAFDMVVPNLYAPLMMGEPVTLLPQDFDPAQIGKLLSEAGPFNFIKMTPGHLDLLTEQLGAEQAASLAALLSVGADAFPARSVNRWLEIGGDTRVLNEYGPTEISVANSTFAIEGRQSGELIPIGKPIPNTTMYVLDEALQPVPVGVVGELCIGGTGVVRGYNNLPDRTASAFVPDPYAGVPGARMYRTGDLARVLPDGNLDFLGRVDDQVKIRGYRVELGEIQSQLTSHPAVRDAVVVPRTLHGDTYLAAYWVPDTEELPTEAELAEFCRGVLPHYMVPAVFTALDAIPLNQNGKVDRKALPTPGLLLAAEQSPYVAPRTETERVLAEIWQGVLGVQEIGVEHDLFALGGSSLLLLRAVARIRSQGYALDVRDILECRTVADLAARLDAPAGGDDHALLWLRKDGTKAPLFCVHPVGGSAHWYLPLAARLRAGHPVAAFEAAVTAPVDSVEQIAARYLGELLEAQPHGPHHLLAWSSGSTIAWELARQLVAAGHREPRLVLIDPAADFGEAGGKGDDLLFTLLENRFAEREAAATEQEAERLGAEITDLLTRAGFSAGTDLLDGLRARLAAWRALTRAMNEYRYDPLTVPLRLVVTDEAASGRHTVSGGRGYQAYLDRWNDLTGTVLTVDRVAGDHDDVFSAPQLDDLIEVIHTTMEEGEDE